MLMRVLWYGSRTVAAHSKTGHDALSFGMEARIEEVEYRGFYYRRYPDSKSRSDHNYFRCESRGRRVGRRYLHRDVWSDANGPIPEGHHVHHIDGDTGNNALANLACVPAGQHQELHVPTSRQRSAIAYKAIRPRLKAGAAEWHRSEEGRAWHSEQARRAYEKRVPLQKRCDRCGAKFGTMGRRESDRFCSNACRAAARRASRVDDIERACARCGEAYRASRYAPRKFCSKTCASRSRFPT